MSSKAVTEYKGIKYSLQPHGLKSKLWMAFATFVAAFGGALAVASPAEGAGPISVAVCGNSSSWYVNDDEGDRAPLATSDGLVFSPRSLIHHQTNIALASLGDGGTYVADPAPDSNFRFSVEIINQTPINGKSGYATLHWDGAAWFIGGADASQGQYEGHEVNAADLIGEIGRFGEIGPDSHVISFGVGYTNSPPGAITSLVSSISFTGQNYDLACPAAVVPGPTVTVVKTVTVAVAPSTSNPVESPSASPTPGSTSTIPQLIPTPSLSPAAADSGGGSSLAAWGIGVAGVTGVALATMGAIGIIRNRRRQTGRHHAGNTKTQLVPVVPGDENAHDISDYGPEAEFDQSLGGRAGDSYWQANTDTEPLPDDPDPDRPYGAPW